ncbi:hypothetical protein JTB14_006447 [Gonioctena quinquepunctata]|nr:hypothetical protein JTB14_006447 [Gonioctena quinquepunctata]
MKCCSIHLILFAIFYFEIIASGIVSHRSNKVCPAISIKNGAARRRGKGRMVKFACKRSFLLAGERHSTCTQGRWEPAPPKCVRATCKPVTSLQNNDKVLIYPTHNGAVQHFFCKPGYVLKGPADVFCDGYKWDNNAPTCLVANTKPKLFCDFEEEDLCGWTHDLNHDFDWIRENYGTPSGSIGTGPTFDHTKGVGGDGYYMYIESSSRNENDTARLISPVYDKMDQEEICLEFFYHMFGSTIGSLRVYLKNTKDKWTLDPSSAIFSKSGNQGDKWYRGFHYLGVVDYEFQIIFEGVRGSGYVSDIAIDDVKITTNCPNEDSYSTESESPMTEIIPIIDSCESRCGQMESVASESHHLTCDCDDECFYKSRCCPDYYDICAFGSTSSYDISTTDMSNATYMDGQITAEVHLNHSTETIVNTTETAPRITFPANESKIPTTSINTPYFSKSSFISYSPKIYTPKTTSKKIFPKFTRPIIHIQTPPTTPKIMRKVIFPTPSRKPTTTSRIYYKPQSTSPNKEMDTNDVKDVPRPTINDEGLFLTPLLPGDESPKEWSDEYENSLGVPHLTNNFSESGKLLFSQKDSDSPDINIFLVAVGATVAVVFVSIVIFVVVWKYRWPRSRMHFSNGESQSDVRFLTSDEIIDFSLSDCYDE